MSDPVGYNIDRVEVPFTKNGSWQSVSLDPYLSADAVAAMLVCTNEGASSQTGGALTPGTSPAWESILQSDNWIHMLVGVSAPGYDIWAKGTSGNIHLYVLGELRSPTFKIHPDPVFVGLLGGTYTNRWINRDVTLLGGDSASDVEAVLLGADMIWGDTSSWGSRALGSTFSELRRMSKSGKVAWVPCATDDGAYQIYIQGKAPPFDSVYYYVWEIGYATKDGNFHAIFNPEIEQPPSASDWATTTIGSQVPRGASGWLGTLKAVNGGIRAVGSTNPTGDNTIGGNQESFVAPLNDDMEYQYKSEWQYRQVIPLAYSSTVVYPESISSGIVEVITSDITPVLESVSQCDWFDPADEGWRALEGAREFTSPAEGGWRTLESERTFTDPAGGGWRTRKPCG